MKKYINLNEFKKEFLSLEEEQVELIYDNNEMHINASVYANEIDVDPVRSEIVIDGEFNEFSFYFDERTKIKVESDESDLWSDYIFDNGLVFVAPQY